MLLPHKVSHAQEASEVPGNTLLTGDGDIVVEEEEEEERIWVLGGKDLGFGEERIWARKSWYDLFATRAEIYCFDSYLLQPTTIGNEAIY